MIYDETHPGPDEYTALDRLDGQRIVATVRRDGRSAETVQDVQAVWELLTGRDIEWGRVTIGGRQGDGSSSWLITVPPAQYRRDRFLLWVGDCDVQESVDSWEWRSGIDFSCPPPPLPRSVTTRRPGPPPQRQGTTWQIPTGPLCGRRSTRQRSGCTTSRPRRARAYAGRSAGRSGRGASRARSARTARRLAAARPPPDPLGRCPAAPHPPRGE